ncbi:MAG: hypothetical protein INR73_25845 [Williamsia sp.]|nr:hypothetical protein [Williamsia sp.]
MQHHPYNIRIEAEILPGWKEGSTGNAPVDAQCAAAHPGLFWVLPESHMASIVSIHKNQFFV